MQAWGFWKNILKRALHFQCQVQLSYVYQGVEKTLFYEIVTIRFQGYRDERGQYDGMASIEMF